RLNRAGRPVAAEAVIVAHLEEVGPKADDPVYGDRIAKTWEALKGVAKEASVDFGIEQFPQQLTERADELVSPKSDAPVLLPRYVDLWSHTSPIPNADPEVALFLHGPDRSPASVQIVWRADIHRRDLVSAERERAWFSFRGGYRSEERRVGKECRYRWS